jgi:hypothetical protein
MGFWFMEMEAGMNLTKACVCLLTGKKYSTLNIQLSMFNLKISIHHSPFTIHVHAS